MLMHAIAHGGCSDTVRKSALEVDSGRKIPCRTGGSNPCQYSAWIFSGTLSTEISSPQKRYWWEIFVETKNTGIEATKYEYELIFVLLFISLFFFHVLFVFLFHVLFVFCSMFYLSSCSMFYLSS